MASKPKKKRRDGNVRGPFEIPDLRVTYAPPVTSTY
jgi:hypothetical protein